MPIAIIDDLEQLIPRLRSALQMPLPGHEAQLKMAPVGRRIGTPDASVRQSATLALLHASTEGLALIFTLRPTTLKHHGGQISFPGGGREATDRTYADTALRETHEELGIDSRAITILGELTPLYIAPSRNLVHPFVGWLPHLPPVHPDPVEVADVVTVSLRALLDPTTRGDLTWQRNGQTLTAPCYRTSGGCIWGATAMMLSELLEILASLVAESSPAAADGATGKHRP